MTTLPGAHAQEGAGAIDRVAAPGPPPAPPASGRRGFAASAARLAGLAGALLGWRADEFWRATPEELAGVLAAMGGEDGAAAGTADLARMQEMFPDG